MASPDDLSRRAMFMKLGLIFSGFVSMMLGVPILGYVLSPVVRGRKAADGSWVALGSVDQFPLAKPASRPIDTRASTRGTARRGTSPAGYAASMTTRSRSSRPTAPTWAVRFAGSRSLACSCARATAAPTTPTVRARRALRSAHCSSTPIRSIMER
jgi:hypothetical protein